MVVLPIIFLTITYNELMTIIIKILMKMISENWIKLLISLGFLTVFTGLRK